MRGLRRFSGAVAVVMLLGFNATPLAACAAYISCSYQGGPCSGTLELGYSLQIPSSWDLGFLTFYFPPDLPCISVCSYHMSGGGETWEQQFWNWDCDMTAWSFSVQWPSGGGGGSGGTGGAPPVPPGG